MSASHDSMITRPIRFIEKLGLAVILFATCMAIYLEVAAMWRLHTVGVADLLLLFMYLELIAMAEVYWRMGKLPVRMPLYVAMVGIARHLMAEQPESSSWDMVSGAAAIFLLSAAVLIVRYGHLQWPYTHKDDGRPDQ
jgi:protein PsiE